MFFNILGALFCAQPIPGSQLFSRLPSQTSAFPWLSSTEAGGHRSLCVEFVYWDSWDPRPFATKIARQVGKPFMKISERFEFFVTVIERCAGHRVAARVVNS